jgi:predicted ATP-grasp superfamily ATP-dependent carboligase
MAEAKSPTQERALGRVLVTFSRSWQALAAIRSLGSRGLEVVTGDELALTPGALSKYSVDSFTYPNAAADPEGFLDALEDAVRRFRPADGVPYVLLPVHRETYLIARHRARFEAEIALALPPSELIEEVRDKGRLVELAQGLEILTPRTWSPSSSSELEGQIDDVRYPAFVKVRRGVAGVGIEKVESASALRSAFETLSSQLAADEGLPIIQEAAAGDDYCVSALLDNGQTRAMMTYRNLYSITEAAPGAIRKTVEAPAPEAAAVRLLEGLGWHGVAEVDFLWTGKTGDPAYLIEINPRLFGGLFQAIASGVDYPWMLYRLALGEEIEPPEKVDLGVISETPIFGLLATLRETMESAGRWEALERAWGDAKGLLAQGALGESLATMWDGLKEGLDPDQRREALESLLAERKATISQLFADDDPKAALGLLYPLAIFLGQGKITSGMVVGAQPVNEGASESR